jgi:hypothetical protein
MTEIHHGLFTVSAKLTVLMSNLSFIITTCYGPADDGRKQEFLQRDVSAQAGTGTPWLITSDFNLIYQANDKNNLNLNRRLMGKFRTAIDACEMLELCLHNRRFTWSNERQNLTLVRLNRAFCNGDWEMIFPRYVLNALSTGASDHCPIILTRQDTVLRRASFKFENQWLHTQGFSDVVQ